jgi:hypothetical protein
MGTNTEVKVGQQWKSKNADPKLGYNTITIIDILTREVVTINMKIDSWKGDSGVFRTMRVETIKKEYNLL